MAEYHDPRDQFISNPLTVTDLQEDWRILEIIHDEWFDFDDIRFSSEDGVVTIPFNRADHTFNARTVRQGFLSRTIEVDVVRSILTIKHVRTFSVDDRAQIGGARFNKFSLNDSRLVIDCTPDCILAMHVSDFEMMIHDQEIRGKARRDIGWFWDSGPGKLIE